MKISKKQLIRLIKEQIKNKNSDLDEAIFKAADLCRNEFKNSFQDGRDSFSNFENLVEKYLGRPLGKDKNDSEFRRVSKLIDRIAEANDRIEYAYRVNGEKQGKMAKHVFEKLLDQL